MPLSRTADDESQTVMAPNRPSALSRVRVERIPNPSLGNPSNANFRAVSGWAGTFY